MLALVPEDVHAVHIGLGAVHLLFVDGLNLTSHTDELIEQVADILVLLGRCRGKGDAVGPNRDGVARRIQVIHRSAEAEIGSVNAVGLGYTADIHPRSNVPDVRTGIRLIHNGELHAGDAFGQLLHPGFCLAEQISGQGHILPNLARPNPADFGNSILVTDVVLPVVDGGDIHAPVGLNLLTFCICFFYQGSQRDERRGPFRVVTADFYIQQVFAELHSLQGVRAEVCKIIEHFSVVGMIYQPYFADPRPENMPVLGNLLDALMAQGIPEAERVAQALDLYVNGSLNFFNHRTTVDIRNRLVCFDIKGLGKNLKKPGMLIVQDAVWNTVTVNRSIGRATWYFVDEFHLLLKEEQTAAYSAEIWKRFRKWGGVPTGATQNPKDLLSSPEIENILENSDFIYLLNLSAGDRKLMTERLNISTEQLAYVTNSEPGHGLLFFNNVILPFADDFPKDTELYKLLTTKPSEVEHK